MILPHGEKTLSFSIEGILIDIYETTFLEGDPRAHELHTQLVQQFQDLKNNCGVDLLAYMFLQFSNLIQSPNVSNRDGGAVVNFVDVLL